jgi:dTDP-glucose 4,6-dehydratase
MKNINNRWCGFIGSHVVRLCKKISAIPNIQFGRADLCGESGEYYRYRERAKLYFFIKGDIVDAPFIDALFAEHQFDSVFTS